MIRLLAHPCHTPLPSVISTTHRKTEKERHLPDGRRGYGVGEELNHTRTTASKLVHYKLFNTLWPASPILTHPVKSSTLPQIPSVV
jgi:hypothetical protein